MYRIWTAQEVVEEILAVDKILESKDRSVEEGLITEEVDEYNYYLVDILVSAKWGQYVYPKAAEILDLRKDGRRDILELYIEDNLRLEELIDEVDRLLGEINELLPDGLYLEVREEGFCIVYREEVVE